MRNSLLLTAAIAAAPALGHAAPANAAAAAPVVVEIHNMHFTPDTLTVPAGTKVTWVNEDEMPHTVMDRGRAFRSAALDAKDSYSYTFAAPGEFAYYCTLHPMMVGKIIVKPGG